MGGLFCVTRPHGPNAPRTGIAPNAAVGLLVVKGMGLLIFVLHFFRDGLNKLAHGHGVVRSAAVKVKDFACGCHVKDCTRLQSGMQQVSLIIFRFFRQVTSQ